MNLLEIFSEKLGGVRKGVSINICLGYSGPPGGIPWGDFPKNFPLG
jgi:hypothetical protein